MGRDSNWPEQCTLMGCVDPYLRPHHHHFVGGHLDVFACGCGNVDQPGTKPKEK